MGNFAPFHSQKQKMDTSTIPPMSVPMTMADDQENVIPPWINMCSADALKQVEQTIPI